MKCCISFFRFLYFNFFVFYFQTFFFLLSLSFSFSLPFFHYFTFFLPVIFCHLQISGITAASQSPYPGRNISHRTNMDAKLPSSNKLARQHWSCGGQAFISASRSMCGRTAWKPRHQIRMCEVEWEDVGRLERLGRIFDQEILTQVIVCLALRSKHISDLSGTRCLYITLKK